MSFFNKKNKNSKSNKEQKSFIQSLRHWLKSGVHGEQAPSYFGAEAEEKAEANENKDPLATYIEMEVKGLKASLKFPASFLVNGNELRMLAPMKVSSKKVNNNGLMVLIGMIAGFILPLMLPVLGSLGFRFIVSIAAVIGVWFINYLGIKHKYAVYSFKNQLRFNTFLTVLDLSELKRGYSINALLAKAAQRFKDKTLSDAVSTLNSRIQDKPTSPEPYLVFAREFSTTQRARLFLMSVYRMAQGNYDDAQIKSLKHSASDELSYQSKKLANKKIGKFNKLQLMEFIGFILYMVTYILYFIGKNVFQLMKGAM